MEYPHTTINADLSTLARELRARDLTDLANKAESALSQYRKKKQFYTGRIEELSAAKSTMSGNMSGNGDTYSKVASLPEYPHTTITADLADLIDSLEESSSPERDKRLELAARVRADYARKHEFLFRELGSRL
jgi:hypothetical protein